MPACSSPRSAAAASSLRTDVRRHAEAREPARAALSRHDARTDRKHPQPSRRRRLGAGRRSSACVRQRAKSDWPRTWTARGLWNASVAKRHRARATCGAVRSGHGGVLKGPRRPGGIDACRPARADRQGDALSTMFGGAMRQIGMLAAACDFGLTHNLARLAEDHANARMIAEGLPFARRQDPPRSPAYQHRRVGA